MATLPQGVFRPNSTVQLGSVASVVGTSADAALSDSSDTTYVQFPAFARLENQVCRVGFPDAKNTLPAGAKVLNVAMVMRQQTVTSDSTQPVVCNHWMRSTSGDVRYSGQQLDPFRRRYTSICPTAPTATWVEIDLPGQPSAPDGTAWDPETNLTGFTYDLGRDDVFSPALRISSLSMVITYQEISTITVTGPTGTQTTTRPTITWDWDNPNGAAQQAYQWAVYTAAQVADPDFEPFGTAIAPLQSSGGFVLGEVFQAAMPNDLTDGTYTVYVQGTSQWDGPGTFPTEIASSTWTRAAAAANPPPAANLSMAWYDADSDRVELVMAPGGSSPATAAYTVLRSLDGGQSFTNIPSLTEVPANGLTPVTGYDYTAPLNVIAQYQVVALGGSPFEAAATPSTALSVEPAGDDHRLINPANPLQNTIIPVAMPKSDQGIKITMRQMQMTAYPITGDTRTVMPVVSNGAYYAREFQIELIYDVEALETFWSAMDLLTAPAAGTLLWKQPNGTYLWVAVGPGGSGQDMSETYAPVAGMPSQDMYKRRKLTLTEQDPPDFF